MPSSGKRLNRWTPRPSWIRRSSNRWVADPGPTCGASCTNANVATTNGWNRPRRSLSRFGRAFLKRLCPQPIPPVDSSGPRQAICACGSRERWAFERDRGRT